MQLEDGDAFYRLEGELSFLYGFSRKLKLEVGMRSRQNVSVIKRERESIKESGLESYFVKALYSRAIHRRLVSAFTLEVRESTYQNDFYESASELPDDYMVLGDGEREFTLGLALSWQWDTHSIFDLWAGYRIPAKHLAQEIPYVGRAVWIGSAWAFYAGVDGVASLNNDEFSEDPEQRPLLPVGNTRLYNGLNRQYIAGHLGLYRSFSRWRWGLEAGSVFNGTSTDGGGRVIMTLVLGNRGYDKDDRKIEEFKEYTIEATVTKVSPKGSYLQIDQGTVNDVEKGMKFDIFKTGFMGENTLVAEGIVHIVKSSKSLIKLSKKIKKVRIKEGFVARAR